MTQSTPAPGRGASRRTGGTSAGQPSHARRVGPAEVRRALSLIDGSMVLMPFIPLVIAVTSLADIGWSPTATLATVAFTVAIVLGLPAFVSGIRAAGHGDGAGRGPGGNAGPDGDTAPGGNAGPGGGTSPGDVLTRSGVDNRGGGPIAEEGVTRSSGNHLGERFTSHRWPLAIAVCGIVVSVATATIIVLSRQPELAEIQRLAFVPAVSVIITLVPRLTPRSALFVSAGLPAALSLVLSWFHGEGVFGGPDAHTDAAAGQWETALALAALLAGVGVILWLSLWPVIWLRRVLTDLDRARSTESRLAVAEERLRFSRDLHDVLGRRMSQIAVQSELIAVLAEREAGADSRAAESARTVRHVAVESLEEIRALVRGYRSIDVRAELAGARRLLESAAIDVEVVGDPDVMPVHLHEAAAWVIREAVTNILRHSQARTATIAFAPDRLEIRDAAADAERAPEDEHATRDPASQTPVADGTGLTGLRERAAAVGGRLRTAHSGNGFRLVVEFTGSASGTGAPAPRGAADRVPDVPDVPGARDAGARTGAPQPTATDPTATHRQDPT